jgi:hypothetical protein
LEEKSTVIWAFRKNTTLFFCCKKTTLCGVKETPVGAVLGGFDG